MITATTKKHRTRADVQRDIVSSWPSIIVRAVSKGATKTARATLPQKPGLLQTGVTKTAKGEKMGYLTGILYLAPALESGRETCAFRSRYCTDTCLRDSGQLSMSPALNSRLWKTALYFGARSLFFELLALELAALEKRAKKIGKLPAARLDGTSDLGLALQRYQGAPLYRAFPGVQFYDYTKSAKRMRDVLSGRFPGYSLTFSYSGANGRETRSILNAGGNVAVAFDARPEIKGRREADPLPTEWRGFDVVSGDETDLRFLDKQGACGTVIGLSFKASKQRGRKLKLAGPFVQRVGN